MTNTAVATANNVRALTAADDEILSDEKLWQVVSSGDLKGLSASQKSAYYLHRCRVEGLNPASQPFQYLTLQGKEILYATRSAADQLRKLHGISIVSVECVEDGEYISYEVRVRDRDHREDFEIGSVFVGTAKGVDRSNARMKALTKAKRRATYSICGTGALDETEVGDILPAAEQPESTYASLPKARPQPRVDVAEAQVRGLPVADPDVPIDVDYSTGEIVSSQQGLPENGVEMLDRQQRGRILFLAGKLGWEMDAVNGFAAEMTGISNIDLLSRQRAAYVIEQMEGQLPPGKPRAS
jgi:hypothetical protein